MKGLNAFDFIDLGEIFEPHNIERWGLFLLFIAFGIGGYIYVDRELKRREERPTHRYNRSTGKVEKNDEQKKT
jgi:hypothetical protein